MFLLLFSGWKYQNRMAVSVLLVFPLSPLLANILLDDLDKELEIRGHRFVRYADDFIIMVKSLRAGNRVMASKWPVSKDSLSVSFGYRSMKRKAK